MVIDHTSYSVSEIEGDHTLIASDEFIKSDVILGKEKIEAPMLFKGIAHSVNAANSLAVKVLSASPAAYSANPNSKLSTPPAISGTSISLVSVVQGERMQHNFIQKNKQKAVKWMRRKDERSHSPNILLVNFLTKLSDSVNVLTNHRANTTEFSGQYHASLVVLAQIAMNMSAVLNEL